MITSIKLAWLLVVLVGSIGPGLLAVRRLKWSPLERLCGAVILSQALLYLLAGSIYLVNAPGWTHLAIAVGCLGCCAAARNEIAAYLRNRSARRALAGFGLLVCWGLALVAMIRTYSGGEWALDWLEHYQRTQFFLEHQPLDTRFTNAYLLPARPPLMNLLVGHYLAASVDRFEAFQVASLYLNLLLFVPAVLFLRLFGRRAERRSAELVLLGFFAANAMLIQNATYPWTKSLATFHVLAGIWFQLRALHRGDSIRLSLALTAFAVGVLVHYSAAPFALFAGVHLLIRLVRRRTIALPRAALAAIPAAVLLATWFGWSAMTYGVRDTITSTTTFGDNQVSSAPFFVAKLGRNILYSIVPHPLRLSPAEFKASFFQPSEWGYVRDYAFTMIQGNLILAIGLFGGIAVLALLPGALQRARDGPAGADSKFWLTFILGLTVLTIATHPTIDRFGVAHVCSQPLVVLGVILLAARFRGLPRWARVTLVIGAALDFAFGIFLQVGIEHWKLTLAKIELQPGFEIMELTTDMPARWGVEGAIAKDVLNHGFLGDHLAGIFPAVAVFSLIAIAALLALVLRAHRDIPSLRSLPGLALAGGGVVWLAFGLAVTAATGAESKPFRPAARGVAVAEPTSSAEPLDRAIAIARMGGIQKALEQLGDLFALDPRPGIVRYLVILFGNVYSVKLPQPAVVAEEVMKNPRVSGSQNELGLILLEAGHPQAAAARFEAALKLDPQHPIINSNVARAYLELGRLDDAARYLQNSARLDPSNPTTRYILAAVLFRTNHREEAIASLREALRLKPDYAEAAAALRQLSQ